MEIVTWNDSYATGNAMVDSQHKHLFGLVNSLHEAILAQKGKDVLEPTLDKLAKYVVEHFATEERLMREKNYPQFQRHHQKHVELTKQATDIISNFKSGKLTLTMTLSKFLGDWIRHHIHEEDTAMITWLKTAK